MRRQPITAYLVSLASTSTRTSAWKSAQTATRLTKTRPAIEPVNLSCPSSQWLALSSSSLSYRSVVPVTLARNPSQPLLHFRAHGWQAFGYTSWSTWSEISIAQAPSSLWWPCFSTTALIASSTSTWRTRCWGAKTSCSTSFRRHTNEHLNLSWTGPCWPHISFSGSFTAACAALRDT